MSEREFRSAAVGRTDGRAVNPAAGPVPGKQTLAQAEVSQATTPAPSTAATPTATTPRDRSGASVGMLFGGSGKRDEALDPATEASLLGLIERPLAAGDAHAVQTRTRELVAAFQAIPGEARKSLRERLAVPRAGDRLCDAFRTRLDPATQARLAQALRGELVPLPVRHEALSPRAFIAHLSADPIRVEPSPLVIHPRLAPHVIAEVSLASEHGPPSDGAATQVHVRVLDAAGAERGTARVPWPGAAPTSGAAAFTFDSSGRYRIECEIIQDGHVIAQRRRTVDVTSPGAELATHAGVEAAQATRAAGGGAVESATAAGVAALQAGPAGDLATAARMAPAQRQDAHRQIVARMAGDMAPAARAQLGDDRNVLEFAAANAVSGPATLATPTTPPADQVTLQGMDRAAIEVSADPVFLRHWVEQTYQAQGFAGVEQLPDLVADRAADDFAITRDRSRQRFAIQRVIPALQHQIQILQSEARAFERQFGAAATHLVNEMLDDSERVARAEMARYGIDVRTQSMTTHGPDDKPSMVTQTVSATTVHGGDNTAARDMAGAARELAANQREIDRMRARVAELHDIQRLREHAAPGAGAGAGAEPAPPVDPFALASAPAPERLAELLGSLDRLVTQADRAHQARIAMQTEAHPLLASYKRSEGTYAGVDADALELLQPSGRGQAIHDRIAPVLANIAATRAALGNRLNVWKEPRVVQLTTARMLVAPGSLRSAIIERKIAAEQEGVWTDWAITALSFGLAVLTAIPTGGSSLAAGVVVAASVAGAVTDVYLVVDHVRAYRLDDAKAGTDLDAQARAISTEHPSLFWLAFDLVATGAGLSAAAKTFVTVASDLTKAERMAATGARLSTEESDIAIARVHRFAREGKLSADGAERAEGKLRLATEGEHEGGTAGHHADESAHRDGGHEHEPRAARHDTRARISLDHLAQLEQRLGVPVVLDDALTNGVELHYVAKRTLFGVGTDIEPTVLKVGRDALLDDVLAHRATIGRVTRYNGVVGKLRGLWDRIVVETEGLNPFKQGTLEWESFEEMSKLDSLIALRRARWNPRTLDSHTLDEEILFLEEYRARHEEVVNTASGPGEINGAGHIDAPDSRVRPRVRRWTDQHVTDETQAIFDEARGGPVEVHPRSSDGFAGESSTFGEGAPEVDAISERRTRRAAGVVADEGQVHVDQHHVFPQEHALWFKERGIEVDEWCIDLAPYEHQAQHGGGEWQLARRVAQDQPDAEWNAAIMKRLSRREAVKRTALRDPRAKLSPAEVLDVAKGFMYERGLASHPFRRYFRGGTSP